MAGIEDFFEEPIEDDDAGDVGDAGDDNKSGGDESGDDDKSALDNSGDDDKTGDDGNKSGADDDAGDGDKGGDADDKTGDDDKTGGKSDSGVEKNADEEHKAEINNLRTMLRDQSRLLKDQTGRSQELTKKLLDAGLIEEDELPAGDSSNDTVIAKQLDLLAETMRMNPKYANFDEVLDESNWDVTVEAMAKLVMAEDGGTLSDRVLDVERYVWEQDNPYLYMYEVITSNMDKFKPAAKDDDSGGGDKGKKKDKPPVAPSLGSMSAGSGKDSGGWTAAKIDELDENDLHTVPKDVYKRYMANDLD